MTETQVSYPLNQVTVVGEAQIADRPWQPLRGLTGVEHKVAVEFRADERRAAPGRPRG